MKKLILTCTLSAIVFCQLFAGSVTSSTAQMVALNYFKGISGITTSNLSATLIYTKAESNQTADFFVFNISPVKGFVIVSADDNAEPVIAYSTESNFFTDFSKIGLSDWMTTAATKIHNIVANNIVADDRIANLWTSYKEGVMVSSNRSSAVAPLVTTTWNQYPYYNLFCPYNSTNKDNAVTGCVATAMSQIMKYWNYPAHGTGSYSYNDAQPSFSNNYGVQSANFGATTYNWAAMPAAVTGPANDTAVATLMYQCGVAVAMDYGDVNQGGSGAYVLGGAPSAQSAYSTYFSYNPSTLQGVLQASYTSSAWITLLQNELNAGRPIQYEGDDPSAGGHTWVCDGYDANNNFHMNWGWGGYDNGYFSLTSLSVAGYNFSTNDGALIGIQPSISTSCGIPSGLSSSSITSSSAVISWSAVSGASSYNIQYKTSSTSTWTTLTSGSASITLSGLASGTTYNYQVQTVCSGGSSAYSTTGTLTTIAGCGAPGSLGSSSITTSGAALSWSAVTGATSYNLQYKASSGTNWTTLSVSGTSYNLGGLTAGTIYNYQVATVCPIGTSTYSSASTFTTLSNCGLTSNLTSSAINTTTATVSWAAVSGATSYTLEYKAGSSSTWYTFSLAGTSVNFSSLTPGTTYNYAVQTVCSSGTSAYTSVSSFTTLTTATCGAPTGLNASTITTTGATLSWIAVSGATSYNLEYKTSSSLVWNNVSVKGTSYTLSGLAAGNVYDYQVQTVCSGGLSAYSTTATFTTLTPPSCGVPTGLSSGSITNAGATISWGAVTGATSYNLEYKTSTSSNWTTISVAGTSKALAGLSASTIYNYAVQTVCSSGSSAYSTAGSFTTSTQTGCGVASGLTSTAVTTNSATIDWTAVSGATSYNIQYKTSSATGWSTISTNTNSVSLSGLSPGTTYNYQVQTVCSGGSSAYSTPGTFTTSSVSTSYCTIKGSTAFEYINSVTFGAFTNTSGNNSGYGDYSSLTIPMASGSKISFSLTPAFTGGSFMEYFVIYIDYNNNGVFTDPGERVFVSTGSTGTTSGSFTVPTGLTGTARMRIIMHYNAAITSPCGTYAWGEAEDYTVNLSASSLHDIINNQSSPNTDVIINPAPTLYPNPVSALVHIFLVPVDGIQTRIDILTITGQIVSSYIPGNSDRQADMDVSGLTPGVYIVRTQYGDDRTSNSKMIKL